MANTMAICRGSDKTRVKGEHRLGFEWAEGEAKTWRTRATVWVGKNGKVEIQVVRDGHKIYEHTIEPETVDADPA